MSKAIELYKFVDKIDISPNIIEENSQIKLNTKKFSD